MSKVNSHIQAMFDMGTVIRTYVSGQLYFSGLHDTPTGYQSGYYLRSTETGIEYIDSTGLFKDITDNFTGVPGTFLKIDSDGTGVVFGQPVETVTSVPTEITKGKLIEYECKLYFGCDNEWKEIDYVPIPTDDEPDPVPPTPPTSPNQCSIVSNQTLSFPSQSVNDGSYISYSNYDASVIINNRGSLSYVQDWDEETNKYINRGYFPNVSLNPVTPFSLNLSGNVVAFITKIVDSTTPQYLYVYNWKDSTSSWEQMGSRITLPVNGNAGGSEYGQNYIPNINNEGNVLTWIHDNNDNDFNNVILKTRTWNGSDWVAEADVTISAALTLGKAANYSDDRHVARFSENGDVLALNKQLSFSSTQFCVLEKTNGTWNTSPTVLKSLNSFGNEVNISKNGKHIVGYYLTGTSYRKIHFFSKSGGSWSESKPALDIRAIDTNFYSDSRFGFVNISDDGNFVTVSIHDKNFTPNRYHVRFFHYDGTAWIQIGGELYGSSTSIRTGQYASNSNLSRFIVANKVYSVDDACVDEYFTEEVDFSTTNVTFLKLLDTPETFESNSLHLTRVSVDESNIEFVEPSTVVEDVLENSKFSQFTGLRDTPDNYEKGSYLRSTETDIEYIDATGLAADIGDEIVNTIVTGQLLAFTGLKDTPTGYDNLSLLQSSDNGINYITADDLSDILPVKPRSYSSVEELPVPASSYDREIFKVGCDLYLSCGGLYVKITTSTQEEGTIPGYPNCVNTTSEALQYRDYIDETMQDYNSVNLLRAMDGLPPVELYNVCLFKQEDFDLVSSNEPWTVRGTLDSKNFAYDDGRNEANSGYKFKKGSDTDFFYATYQFRDGTDSVDLIIGEINSTLRYQEKWKKTVFSDNRGSVNITDDFQHISYVNDIGSSNREIIILDYDEASQDYISNRPKVDLSLAMNLSGDGWLSGNSDWGSYDHKISTDGKRLFVMAKSGNAFSTSLRLFVFKWNGIEWELPHIMEMPSGQPQTMNSNDTHGFLLNEDESLIYLVGGNFYSTPNYSSGGVFRINYENNSMNQRLGQILPNAEANTQVYMNSTGNIITSKQKNTSSTFVWKYDQSSDLWEQIGEPFPASKSIAMCRNGRFFIEVERNGSGGAVYFYNKSSKSFIQIANSFSASRFGFISDSGQSVAYQSAVSTIPLSQIPEIEGDIYNNSVVIEQSNYKWGLFEGNTSINISGFADPAFNFVEWKSSDVTINNSNNIHADCIINNDASITGVFTGN